MSLEQVRQRSRRFAIGHERADAHRRQQRPGGCARRFGRKPAVQRDHARRLRDAAQAEAAAQNVIDDFRKWIEMGAPDPRETQIAEIRVFDHRR